VTGVGIILGTAAYMSPEQAKGRSVDRRADIWAFGVVLFEVLSGRPAFGGESVTDTIARVIEREPDWETLPPTTPAHVVRVIQRCLHKDPSKRLHHIADARIELDEPRDAVPVTEPRRRMSRLARLAPWAIAAMAVSAAAALGVDRWRTSAPSVASRDVIHLDVGYPPGVEGIASFNNALAISPDGRHYAAAGVQDGVRMLFLGRVDRPGGTVVEGSRGVNGVTFSPDGTSLAFVTSASTLVRLSLADQQSRTVTAGTDVAAAGLAWGDSDIVFSRGGALWIVSAEGGEARRLTTLDAARKEILHAAPQVLPGSKFVLFSSQVAEADGERIEAVSIDDGRRFVVVERATGAVWSPTGHLLIGRAGAILAVPFDAETASVHGAGTLVIPAGEVASFASGTPALTLSSSGTLVFLPANFAAKRLVWVNRSGAAVTVDHPPGAYTNPRVSPDGRRVLVDVGNARLDMLDLARGTGAALVVGALGTNFASWTTDGARIVVRRWNQPYWFAADGSGRSGPVPHTAVGDFPIAPGPDPDSVAMVRIQPGTGGDVYLMSLTGAFQPRALVLVETRAYEGGPQFSPDGRWLMYQSDESGQAEIYLRPYPALDRRWQVSAGGGVQARWSRSGREIFYRQGRRMMSVSLELGSEPVFGKPIRLFEEEYEYGQGLSIPNYDVAPDGRFIMMRPEPNASRLRVVLNWTEELKRSLAAGTGPR